MTFEDEAEAIMDQEKTPEQDRKTIKSFLVSAMKALQDRGWEPPKAKPIVVHYDRTKAYKEDELVYAAWTRCKCGAGMAYLKNSFAQGFWACSRQLKHEDLDNNVLFADNPFKQEDNDHPHTFAMMFAWWDFKSENQPSAYGQTTRPVRTEP